MVVAVDDKSWTETKSTTARCNAQRLSISALGATVRRSAIEAGRLPPRIPEDRHGDGQVSGSEASEAAAGWLRAVQHQAAGDRHVDAPRRPRPGIWRGSMWAGGRQAAMAPSITTAAQCNGWAWCVWCGLSGGPKGAGDVTARQPSGGISARIAPTSSPQTSCSSTEDAFFSRLTTRRRAASGAGEQESRTGAPARREEGGGPAGGTLGRAVARRVARLERCASQRGMQRRC